MKPTPSLRWKAMSGAPAAILSLLLLTACSSSETPVAVTEPATLTPAQKINLPVVGSGDESPQGVTPTYTPEGPSAEPDLKETLPPGERVANSPLPSPTPVGAAVSPLPSPTPGGDTPSPARTGMGPGDASPDFTLESAQGGPTTLSDYQGKSNVVLVFYRGQT